MLEQPCPTCGHLLDINEHVCPACGLPRRRIREQRRSTGLAVWFAPLLCAFLGALFGWSISISWQGMIADNANIALGMTTLGFILGFVLGRAITHRKRE